MTISRYELTGEWSHYTSETVWTEWIVIVLDEEEDMFNSLETDEIFHNTNGVHLRCKAIDL